MGYTEGGKNFLYGEEALFLMEKDQLAVIVAADECFTRDAFYNIVVSGISLECYLTFAKLKVRYAAVHECIYSFAPTGCCRR